MSEVLIVGGRKVALTYADPAELVWVEVARRLGMSVERRSDVYAAWDGMGMLAFGVTETLDADDCLAQMIFHEIAHWVTNGKESFHEIDWGFEPTTHVEWREYPAVRLQGWLAQPHGLASTLGPTTNMRSYYDQLHGDFLRPLDNSAEEERIVAHTKVCIERARRRPWCGPLQDGLRATAAIRAAVGAFTGSQKPRSVWS